MPSSTREMKRKKEKKWGGRRKTFLSLDRRYCSNNIANKIVALKCLANHYFVILLCGLRVRVKPVCVKAL